VPVPVPVPTTHIIESIHHGPVSNVQSQVFASPSKAIVRHHSPLKAVVTHSRRSSGSPVHVVRRVSFSPEREVLNYSSGFQQHVA
jgi:hypothetical protein